MCARHPPIQSLSSAAGLRKQFFGRTSVSVQADWSSAVSEPIQEVVESDESVVILCWAFDSRGERPMWKPEHRIAADRSGLRYPSDLTGAEWAIVEPMVPPAKHGGRKRTINVREILNGIFYVLWTGCQWQALPKDLPPKSTVWAYFDLWTW